MTIQTDREDYARFLAEFGHTEESAQAIIQNQRDLIPFPPGFDTLTLHASPIAGVGVFTDRAVNTNQLIAPGRIGGKRTPAGRFINHSPCANAKAVKLTNGDMNIHASRAIDAGEEITLNYRQVANSNYGWQPPGAA